MPKPDRQMLKKWIATVDPEVTLLSLLIVQIQLGEEPYPAGYVQSIYLNDPDRLLDLVDFPDDPIDLKEAWKEGDWQTIGAFLGLRELPDSRDGGRELPTTRGFPP